MNWDRILMLTQVVSSLVLIASILMQKASSGFEGALGSGSGGVGTVRRKRRGFEKFIFNFTIVVAVIFVATFIIDLVI